MSVFTTKTEISSILKCYSSSERDKAKLTALNKVRFELPKDRGLTFAIDDVLNFQNYLQYNEFVLFLNESKISVSRLYF